MAYQYPLNGGRINASVGGNSTSAGAGYQLVSTGTLTLAGGNNITLSQNGPAITISGANIPSQTAYQFSNSNGISFGTNGSTITATVATNYAASNHSHGNPTLNLTNLSGTTASASNGLTLSLSAPAVSSLSQTGIISLSQNGNTISIGAPAFSIGISTLGNTAGTTGTVSNQLIFAGGNNITLSQSTGAGGNTISISGANIPVQTAFSFSNSNGVSFGTNGSTVTASVATSYAASNHSHGNPTLALTNISGTTASASNGLTLSLSAQGPDGIVAMSAGTQSVSSGTMNFANSNGITFGMSGSNQITASHNGITSQSVQTQGVQTINLGGNTAGAMASISSGALSLYGGDNITLSQNANSVTISGAAGGGGGGGIALSANALISSGTASLAASGALTASVNGQTLNISAPATSVLSGVNGISISTTGSTIAFQAVPATTTQASIARWEYPNNVFTTVNTIVQSSLSLQHVQIPFYLTGSAIRLAASMNVSSLTSSGTTGSVGISLNVGVYSLSGSTLSLLTQASTLNSFTFSSAAAGVANFNGVREITSPLVVSLVPGEYWIGAAIRSTTSGSTAGVMTLMGNGNANIHSSASIGVFGASINASARDVYMGQGIYTATVSTMPSSIPFSAINNTNAGYAQRAAFYHAIYSATY